MARTGGGGKISARPAPLLTQIRAFSAAEALGAIKTETAKPQSTAAGGVLCNQ
jgi:hypothetical protein